MRVCSSWYTNHVLNMLTLKLPNVLEFLCMVIDQIILFHRINRFIYISGKVGMEECITMELAYLIEELGMKGGDSFDLQDLLTQSVSNIATKIVFGSRFDYTAKQLENLQFDEFVEKSNMLLRMKFVEVTLRSYLHSNDINLDSFSMRRTPLPPSVLVLTRRSYRIPRCQEEGRSRAELC